jgi:prepilin-type processing-associated H-X9-DG protein
MRTNVARWGLFPARTAALIGLLGLAMPVATMGQKSSEPVRPAPLARYFPRQDLVVYAEFGGLDAHRDAWTKTATYRLLNETTTGEMLEQSLAHLLDVLMARQSEVPVKGRELVALGKHLLRSGFAVGINRAGGVGLPRCLALVIRGAAKGEARSILDRFLRVVEGARTPIQRIEKPGGRTVQVLGNRPGPTVAWWSEGDDLVVSLVAPSGVDAIIAALEGREPSAVDHPTRTALLRNDDANGFVPVGLAFFDMAALPPLPSEAVALGLDRVKRLDYRWGFHGPAIQSIVGAVVPAPRTGIPAFFDQPAFNARHLPPLPGGLAGFTVLSLDTARFVDQVAAALKTIDPRASQPLAQIEAAVQQVSGLKLRDDLLAPLGSRVVFYTFPTQRNAPANVLAGLAQALVFVPKSAVVIEVKDREGVAKALDKLSEKGDRTVPILANPGGGPSVSVTVSSMRKLKGPETGYILPPSSSTLPLPAGLRPTVLLGDKGLVLATSPATARRAKEWNDRSDAAGLPPGDPLAPALDHLPDRLTFLTVRDTQQSMLPDLIVGLPNWAEFLIASQRLSPFALFGIRLPSMSLPSPPLPPGSPPQGATPAFDPELVPEPDSLRPYLFPSVSVLAVDDQGIRFISRESFPTINPATAVPVAIAMLVPAVQSSRVAAQRSQSVNNLKQIGLALHNFHSANDHFPADVRSKDGSPLLSWRVQILPFVEQQALFNEFKLDEPWDSPHNKALIELMPAVFAVPHSPAEPGTTFYRGFSGPRAIFDKAVPKGVSIRAITDGTSNTIAVVEAKEAVPWTKPDSDIPSGEDSIKPEQLDALRAQLGGHFPHGFNVVFCDGSVRFIRDVINLLTLRALITRDGGEVVSSDSF